MKTRILAMFLVALALMGTASAYYCWDGSKGATIWVTHDDTDRSAGTTYDVCNSSTIGTTMTENGVTTGINSQWNESYDYDGDDDYLYNSTTSESEFTGNDNFSYNVWINYTFDHSSDAYIMVESDQTNQGRWRAHITSAELSRCIVQDNGGDNVNVAGSTALNNGALHMITCVYFGHNHTLQLYENGTYVGNGQNNLVDSNIYSANSRYSIGARWWSGGVQWTNDFNGTVDEASVFNYSLNETEIADLYANNTLGAGAPPAPPANVGCTITPHDYNITNGSVGSSGWTDQTSPVANYTVTCYQSTNYACDLQRSGTLVGNNPSPVSNASFNYITSNSTWSEDTAYTVNVTCTNGTYTNTSTSTTVTADATSPTTNITYPTNTTYAQGTTITLNFTYTENNPNQCTYRVNAGANNTIAYTNGTTIASSIGTYDLELWCTDNALNADYQTVSFTIEGSTTSNLTETTPVLATQGMTRTFQATYVPLASLATGLYTPETGNLSHSLPALSGPHWGCDEFNTTHHVCVYEAIGPKIAVYRTSDGTPITIYGFGTSGTRFNRGIECPSWDNTHCYLLVEQANVLPVEDRVYKFDPNAGTISLYASWTQASKGYEMRHLAEAGNGKWWSTAFYGPAGNGSSVANITRFTGSFAEDLNLQVGIDVLQDYLDSDGVYFNVYRLNGTVGNITVQQRNMGTGTQESSFAVKPSAAFNIAGHRGFFYSTENNTVYARHVTGGGDHPYWTLNTSANITGAACNLTYSGTTVSMTQTTPGVFQATIIENNTDKTTGTATSQCTSPAYADQDDSITVKTHNWNTPLHDTNDVEFTVSGDYTDTTDFDGSDLFFFTPGTGLKCVRTRLEGNSLNTTDTANIHFYNYLHLGNILGQVNFTASIHEKSLNLPGDSIGSCTMTLPNILEANPYWTNCSLNPTEDMTLLTDYYVCVDYPRSLGINSDGTLTGTSLLQNVTWSVVNKEYGLALVTENTELAEIGNATGFNVFGIVWDCADPARTLAGIHVNITQQNPNGTGDPLYKNAVTDSSGVFGLDDLWEATTSYITYSDPNNEYQGFTDTFQLSSTTSSLNLSTCLGLPVPPVAITTTWEIYSNVTEEVEQVQTFSQWKPNETFRKDSLLITASLYVENDNGDPEPGLDFSDSTIATTCSYSTDPTAYYITDQGNGFYRLEALIGATNETTLYAYCEDQDYFELNYKATGINQKTRMDFVSFDMRVTGASLLVDQLPNYNWAHATAWFYYNKFDEMNRRLSNENLACQARLELVSGANITSWATANITGNKATANFTTLSTSPPTVYIHWNCTASGFNTFDSRTRVTPGTDAVEEIDCWTANQFNERFEWNKVGDLLQHVCTIKTYGNASLRSLTVNAHNQNYNRDRRFSFSGDSANTWSFKTDLAQDDMTKGLHDWNLEYTNVPSGLAMPNFTYYQFVKVYTNPPKKISPDHCNEDTCPKRLWRGQDYYCTVVTEFEADYTNIVSGIKLNNSNTLITVPAEDTFNAETGIHSTTITIPAVGETGQYGITSDTRIQCYYELYIDNERLVYGQLATDMLTEYDSSYMNDVLGVQSFWSSLINTDEPLEFVLGVFLRTPGQALESMGIYEEGELNILLALFYLIAFCLFIVTGFVVTDKFLEERRGGR